MVDKTKHEKSLSLAIEYLEKAKDILYSVQVDCTIDINWIFCSLKDEDHNYCEGLEESMADFIENTQNVIDELSDYKSGQYDVICDHAESCTQRLVVCEHCKSHSVKEFSNLICTIKGYCSVAELQCKCVKVNSRVK